MNSLSVTLQKLLVMLKLQNEMNTIAIGEGWATSGKPFLRAVVAESAEGMDHHGWAWWKKQIPDMPQLKLEIVDVWHFALSHFIVQCHGNIEEAAQFILTRVHGPHYANLNGPYMIDELDLLTKIELMIGLAVTRDFKVYLLDSIMRDIGMSWDELYALYIGKNMLNRHRQSHGYKAGTYIKTWHGVEDNEYLSDILTRLNPDDEDFQQQVSVALTDAYITVVQASTAKTQVSTPSVATDATSPEAKLQALVAYLEKSPEHLQTYSGLIEAVKASIHSNDHVKTILAAATPDQVASTQLAA